MFNTIILFLESTPFTDFLQRFGYLGIFLFFITIDQINPFPEEVSLLFVGYLSVNDGLNPVFAGLACLAGFVTVDMAYYFASKSGLRLFKRKKGKSAPSWISSYGDKLKNNIAKTITILSFIPRMRMWAPILAGSMKLSFKKFLLVNGLAVSVFTALYIVIGIIFHDSLTPLMNRMKGMQNILFFAAIGIAAAVIFIFEINRRRKLAKPVQ